MNANLKHSGISTKSVQPCEINTIKSTSCGNRQFGTVATICLTFFVLLLVFDSASAFEQLNKAQNLIYDTAHLSNTTLNQEIRYTYRSQTGEDEIVDDRVILMVKKVLDKDKRDIVLDFLSDERHLALPDFNAFRGNPVIIAALEYIAQTFGRDTGGGVLYFRNRIRDALADPDTEVKQTSAQVSGGTIKATTISFSPFSKDSYLADKPEYVKAAFTITLSETVPGGLVGMNVLSGETDNINFHYVIALE